MTVPATAAYFTAYDQLKAFLCGRALTSDLYAPMVAVALACLGTVTAISSLGAGHGQSRRLGTPALGAWSTCIRAAAWLRPAGARSGGAGQVRS